MLARVARARCRWCWRPWAMPSRESRAAQPWDRGDDALRLPSSGSTRPITPNSAIWGSWPASLPVSLLGLLFAFLTVQLRVDQVLVGLAITIFAAGLTALSLPGHCSAGRTPRASVARHAIRDSRAWPISLFSAEALFNQAGVVLSLALLLVPVVAFRAQPDPLRAECARGGRDTRSPPMPPESTSFGRAISPR